MDWSDIYKKYKTFGVEQALSDFLSGRELSAPDGRFFADESESMARLKKQDIMINHLLVDHIAIHRVYPDSITIKLKMGGASFFVCVAKANEMFIANGLGELLTEFGSRGDVSSQIYTMKTEGGEW